MVRHTSQQAAHHGEEWIMRSKRTAAYNLCCGVALCAMTISAIAPVAAAAAAAGESGSNDGNTTTPIKHVIVIIGENRTFDHLFATCTETQNRYRLEPAVAGHRQRRRHTG